MKSKYIPFIYFFFISCVVNEPSIKDNLPEINLSTAYAITNTDIEATGDLIATNLNNEVEYGIVWSETENPTIANNKIIIGKIARGTKFYSKINELKRGTKLYLKAYVKNIYNEIGYSNEISVIAVRTLSWKKLSDLKIDNGQFTGIATKLDGTQLTFLRLNAQNEWEQYKHYNGIYYDPTLTWELETFAWPQVSPRNNALFFGLNLSKDFLKPTAFLGGGEALQSSNTVKTYLKDIYMVFSDQNFLEPIPFSNGPIAHFSLNRNEICLEENNLNVWSYFSLENFIKKKPFPNIGKNYHFIATSTEDNGYVIAENKNENEVLLFEYNDILDSWTKKANFPDKGRIEGICFTLKGKIYYGLGRTTKPVVGYSDLWQFDPKANKWIYFTSYPGAGNIKVMAADMGDYAVLFCGYQVRASSVGAEKYFNANDTWRFTE